MSKGKSAQRVGHTFDMVPDGGVYQLDKEAWPEKDDAVIIKSGFSGDTKNTLSVLKTNHLPFKKWGLVIVLETFAEGTMARFVPVCLRSSLKYCCLPLSSEECMSQTAMQIAGLPLKAAKATKFRNGL